MEGRGGEGRGGKWTGGGAGMEVNVQGRVTTNEEPQRESKLTGKTVKETT